MINVYRSKFQDMMKISFRQQFLKRNVIRDCVNNSEGAINNYIQNMDVIFPYTQGIVNCYNVNKNLFERNFVEYWRRELGLGRNDEMILNVLKSKYVFQNPCDYGACYCMRLDKDSYMTVEGLLEAIYELFDFAKNVSVKFAF